MQLMQFYRSCRDNFGSSCRYTCTCRMQVPCRNHEIIELKQKIVSMQVELTSGEGDLQQIRCEEILESQIQKIYVRSHSNVTGDKQHTDRFYLEFAMLVLQCCTSQTCVVILKYKTLRAVDFVDQCCLLAWRCNLQLCSAGLPAKCCCRILLVPVHQFPVGGTELSKSVHPSATVGFLGPKYLI